MSDLVGNPEDRFSQNEAHLIPVPRLLPAFYYNCHVSGLGLVCIYHPCTLALGEMTGVNECCFPRKFLESVFKDTINLKLNLCHQTELAPA